MEQLAIIRKAIDEGSVVRGSRNQTYQHIADEINKYDGIDNGKHHDATACRKMAHTLKVEDQIRKTADPSKTMTSDAIAIKTKRPILGDDLERLK